MYALPQEFDEKCFIGCVLYEIGFNANQIRFCFAPTLSIVVEGELQLWLNEYEQLSVSAAAPKLELLKLVESTVESVGLDPTRSEFALRFDGDRKLVLLADDNYESYRIEKGERTYVV